VEVGANYAVAQRLQNNRDYPLCLVHCRLEPRLRPWFSRHRQGLPLAVPVPADQAPAI
jgi:hypothetical protein